MYKLNDPEGRSFTCHSANKLSIDKHQIPVLCAGMEAIITFRNRLRPEREQLSSFSVLIAAKTPDMSLIQVCFGVLREICHGEMHSGAANS